MAVLKVYNGSTWDTAIAKVYNGSAWEDKMKFYNGSAWVELYSVSADVVQVSGETISDQDDGFNSRQVTAYVTVHTNGLMYKTENATQTQIDTSTDWVRPQPSYAGTYHVKFTKGGLDATPTYNPGGLSLDTWYALTTTRHLGYQHSTDDTTESGTITVHISDDAGSTTLDTGAFTISATRGLP